MFKAYGRFNRERFDDFAWGNDKIAHRTYGKALETRKGKFVSEPTKVLMSRTTLPGRARWGIVTARH